MKLTLQCLDRPAPLAPDGTADRFKGTCPAGAVCLTGEGARILSGWLIELYRWTSKAWAACGPQP